MKIQYVMYSKQMIEEFALLKAVNTVLLPIERDGFYPKTTIVQNLDPPKTRPAPRASQYSHTCNNA